MSNVKRSRPRASKPQAPALWSTCWRAGLYPGLGIVKTLLRSHPRPHSWSAVLRERLRHRERRLDAEVVRQPCGLVRPEQHCVARHRLKLRQRRKLNRPLHHPRRRSGRRRAAGPASGGQGWHWTGRRVVDQMDPVEPLRLFGQRLSRASVYGSGFTAHNGKRETAGAARVYRPSLPRLYRARVCTRSPRRAPRSE